MNTPCENIRQLWAQSPDGLQDTDDVHTVEEHLNTCSACSTLFERYKLVQNAAQHALSYTPTDDTTARFLHAAHDLHDSQESVTQALQDHLAYTPSPSAENAFLLAARAQFAAQNTAPPHASPTHENSHNAAQDAHNDDQDDQTNAPSTLPIWTRYAAAAAFLLASCAAVFAFLYSTEDPTSHTPGIVFLGGHSGDVRIDDTPLSGEATARLVSGTRIRTGEAAYVHFKDAANAELTAISQTDLDVSSWSPTSTQLFLRRGVVRAKVVHRTPGDLFEIRTPNARITVLGTEFSVAFTPEGETVVKGTSGKVRIENNAGALLGFVTANTELRVPATPQLAEASPTATPTQDLPSIAATNPSESPQQIPSKPPQTTLDATPPPNHTDTNPPHSESPKENVEGPQKGHPTRSRQFGYQERGFQSRCLIVFSVQRSVQNLFETSSIQIVSQKSPYTARATLSKRGSVEQHEQLENST